MRSTRTKKTALADQIVIVWKRLAAELFSGIYTKIIGIVASTIKWRNIASQFIVPARRNSMSIVVPCEKSCNKAGAAKGKQDTSVES